LALMGDPCEEYMICELAAEAVGAITYGIYPTSSQKEVHYLMEDGEACIFIAENQEYADRILPLFDQLSFLKTIVVIDYQGMFMYEHPSLISYETYEKLLQDGEKQLTLNPGVFREMVNRVKPSDAVFIVYTSGTTGNPKGALISHGKHLAGTYNIIDRFPVLAARAHRTVVYLPLCHILGKDVAITTVLFTVPRYLQKFVSNIIVGIDNSSPLKKYLYRISLRIGRQYMKEVWEGRKSPLFKILYFLAYHLSFRPILNKIGFDQLKIALSGGAPLPSEVMALWQIYGVALSEMYGQTETGGAIITGQGEAFPRPGNIGVPPSGWEVRLGENGEILVKGEDIFEGYWNKPDLTKEVIDEEGWLHTGDVGEWTPEGNLKIVDRVRDFIVTSGGKTLSPTYIENALRSSPYISEAVVFGHNRKYISALIEIDFETVSAWARLNNITYTGFTSLADHAGIFKLIATEIEKTNQDLARVEQVKRFRIIPKELDPEEEGEPITPTRKVKRELMYEKFGTLVETMYSDKEERLVAAEIGDVLT